LFAVKQNATYVAFFAMTQEQKLLHTTVMVLQSIQAGHICGYSMMEATDCPAGQSMGLYADWSVMS
jgi:hypothetical protein